MRSNVGILLLIIITLEAAVAQPTTAAIVDAKRRRSRDRYISYWALFHNHRCDLHSTGLRPCHVANKRGGCGFVPSRRCCHVAKSFLYGRSTDKLLQRQERCVCFERMGYSHPKLIDALISHIPVRCGFKFPANITSPANCPKP
ncbi:hypothetical protein LINPERPRIM_LOCUS2932 [Linum perenne]